jgi:hypothetical protein
VGPVPLALHGGYFPKSGYDAALQRMERRAMCGHKRQATAMIKPGLGAMRHGEFPPAWRAFNDDHPTWRPGGRRPSPLDNSSPGYPHRRGPAGRCGRCARTVSALETAVETYIYGYPLVTMEMTRRFGTNTEKPEGILAPMGQFANLREYPAAAFKAVTAPNADTLYSSAFLDLSQGPCWARP